ncbi:CHAT domain-containing protein [Streptomyces sp. JB150]|uniref:CHAT domain-containing protein n=1 Tax=Streptomyces sp. JB150 TaxID=2714844 RepID=UPI00140A1A26|nr:CHAT domain-containing protein [Streptomyces sp. JB150]QIJ64437.1 CHAT domain-containing protein [Streptomyces sp. JB150]
MVAGDQPDDGRVEADEVDEVENLRSTLGAVPFPHPARAALLDRLGRALRSRHRRDPDEALLDEAVAVHREACAAAPLGEEAEYQVNLANALLDLYDARVSETSAPREARELLEGALRSGTIQGQDEATVQNSLASALDRLWDLHNRQEDLRERVGRLRRAVELAVQHRHPRTAMYRAQYADALLSLHSHAPDEDLLAEAQRAAEQALAAAPPGHPDLPDALDSACRVGERLYEAAGRIELLHRAQELAEQAGKAVPRPRGIDGSSLFNTWANVLRTLHTATGEVRFLDRAIEVQRAAVDATRPGDLNRAGVLANMATTYALHAHATGDRTFLPDARDLYRKAIEASPGPREAAAHRGNLARLLTTFPEVFARRLSISEADVLDLAIEEDGRAVAAFSAESAQRRHHTLAKTVKLVQRYEQRHRSEDFEEAVRLSHGNLRASATQAEAARHRLAIAWLWNKRAGHTLAEADLEAGETAYREGLAAYRGEPAGLEIHYRSGLALILVLSAESRIVGGRPFTEAFTERYREATELYRWCALRGDGRVQDRIDRAVAWGRTAARLRDWRQAYEAYRLAMSFVPLLAPLHLPRPDREQLLRHLEGVAADAAACAISMGDPYAALEFLESSRGLLLTESLSLREDLARLGTHAPRLGSRFLRLRDQVAADGSAVVDEDPVRRGLLGEALTARRRRADELREVLDDLRRVPGLERFLRPPDVRGLVADSAGAHGSVVVVNTSRLRSDALIVRDGTVRVLSLPELTGYGAGRKAAELQEATWRATHRGSSPQERAAAEGALAAVLDWLWRTVARPVLDDLDRPRPAGPASRPRAAPVPGRPRVWWCCTGALAGLPLHAAAALTPHPSDGESVIGRVVSSYVPTLAALAYSRGTALSRDPRVLAVGMRDTPGYDRLPGAHREVAAVRRWAPGATELYDGDARRAVLLDMLRAHDWVHFAGHAEQDPEADDNGHLVCHDHATAGPLTTGDLLDTQAASRSFLAYLAACDTARGRAHLTDQAMHLAGGMQAVGFAHVIASFWPLQSYASLAATQAFYTSLPRGTAVSHDAVARAVDHAVRLARENSPDRPSWWAALHHIGP